MSKLTLARIKRLLGDKVLVRPYRRPERIGSIIVPETARDNSTLTAWEFVRADFDMRERWGVELRDGDLIRTAPIGALYLANIDDVNYYIVTCDSIREVIPWQS